MEGKQSPTVCISKNELPDYIKQNLKKMSPKKRQELLDSLLEDNSKPIGFFDE